MSNYSTQQAELGLIQLPRMESLIRHVSYLVDDLDTLESVLASSDISASAARAESILVQVYCAQTDVNWLTDISRLITGALPRAVLVGATTVGEIASGQTFTGRAVVGITFFDASQVIAFALACPPSDEQEIGIELGRRIQQRCSNVAGVLLLTPLSINMADLLDGFEQSRGRYAVFGGGAGDYASMSQSLVFTAEEQLTHGVVAVALMGADLHVESRTYLGWRALNSKIRCAWAMGRRRVCSGIALHRPEPGEHARGKIAHSYCRRNDSNRRSQDQ